MLIGLVIREVVLIEALDLSIGSGLTALTGETGAGKSIILDSLGLATGARADAGLVRRGAAQASVSAIFSLAPDHPALMVLEEKGLSHEPGEDLILRRTLSADGRSRAFVNDQATSAAVLRELGDLLLEVHGQHETVGLLDTRRHQGLLDAFAGNGQLLARTAELWRAWRAARERRAALVEEIAAAEAEAEELSLRLSELDRLAPEEGEETRLAGVRAVLGSAEKALSDIASAREAFSGLTQRLAQSIRTLERARERVLQSGAEAEAPAAARLVSASEAVERALVEAQEAEAAIDAAADAFEFRPDELERTEERLFELRAMARKLNVSVENLPEVRVRFAERLRLMETSRDDLAAAEAELGAARAAYLEAAGALSAARERAAGRLAEAVMAELGPLRLEKARFRILVEHQAEERAGPQGMDRVAFEVATNPGAPFGELGAIASGGELARFALALKASLATRSSGPQPLMIFDEVDQGVGGAVADAVGARLKRLGEAAQVLVVTHSPQVAARAEAHWRISKTGDADKVRTAVEILGAEAREEEIARMLAGAQITDAARAAARALMNA